MGRDVRGHLACGDVPGSQRSVGRAVEGITKPIEPMVSSLGERLEER
jgi:hypothetical protein